MFQCFHGAAKAHLAPCDFSLRGIGVKEDVYANCLRIAVNSRLRFGVVLGYAIFSP